MKNALIYGDRVNPYYIPEIIKNIFRLVRVFNMVNLVNDYFIPPYTNATFTSIENDFCQIKKILIHKLKQINLIGLILHIKTVLIVH